MFIFLKKIILFLFEFILFITWSSFSVFLTILIALAISIFPFIFIPPILHFVLKIWGKLIIYSTFSRITLINSQHLLVDDPVVIIANHRSLIDIPLGAGFFHKKFLFLSKKEIFSIPLLGHGMKKAGFISVDRSSPRRAAIAILDMVRKINLGKNILIYPEGTRNYRSDQMLPLKSGAMAVAIKSKVTILPIVTFDTGRVYSSSHKFRLSPQKLKISVLEPITISNKIHPGNEKSKVSSKEKLKRIQNLMQNTFDKLKNDTA